MPISFCVMYWANPDTGDELSTYLDGIVEMMIEHGGAVLHRGITSASDDQPLEIHMCEFESADRLDNFMGDARRAELAPERERLIARMEIMLTTMRPVPASPNYDAKIDADINAATAR